MDLVRCMEDVITNDLLDDLGFCELQGHAVAHGEPRNPEETRAVVLLVLSEMFSRGLIELSDSTCIGEGRLNRPSDEARARAIRELNELQGDSDTWGFGWLPYTERGWEIANRIQTFEAPPALEP